MRCARLKLMIGLKRPLPISPMRRGEVWWVSFDPSLGGEIQKKRPAVIVSNDAANEFLNRVQVVPLTSQTQELYPSEAYVSLGGETRKAMADQLMTVSKTRLSVRIDQLTQSDLKKIGNVIRVQLGLVSEGDPR
jgi:mRNA interferase MazF